MLWSAVTATALIYKCSVLCKCPCFTCWSTNYKRFVNLVHLYVSNNGNTFQWHGKANIFLVDRIMQWIHVYSLPALCYKIWWCSSNCSLHFCLLMGTSSICSTMQAWCWWKPVLMNWFNIYITYMYPWNVWVMVEESLDLVHSNGVQFTFDLVHSNLVHQLWYS